MGNSNKKLMYENQKNADAFSKMAYNRFDQLKAESKTQMDDFIRQIFVQWQAHMWTMGLCLLFVACERYGNPNSASIEK